VINNPHTFLPKLLVKVPCIDVEHFQKISCRRRLISRDWKAQMAFTVQKRMRSWARNIMEICFDHHTTQNSPASPENSRCDDPLSDKK
jgi:hypothetical protein